jgi:hypothetical protein
MTLEDRVARLESQASLLAWLIALVARHENLRIDIHHTGTVVTATVTDSYGTVLGRYGVPKET